MLRSPRNTSARTKLLVATGVLAAGACAVRTPEREAAGAPHSDADEVVVPKLWDERALAGWATPVAGLGVAPSFVSEAEYYATPVDNLRTYPVYHPDREPPGYREALVRRGPRPMIEPAKLRTRSDWIAAGRRVFEELDTATSRSDDPLVIAHFTSAATVEKYRDATHDVLKSDGTFVDYRWVVDTDGKLKLSLTSCAGCHSRLMPDGSLITGAPGNFDISDAPAVEILLANSSFAPKLSRSASFYAEYGVPWRDDDVHARFRSMSDAELGAAFGDDDGAPPGTVFARFGGSPFFPTRMADLRGVGHRRWLDATATHKNRGPEDVARYGIQVEFAEATVFGAHHVLPADVPKMRVRPSDEAMYALALYLYTLEPAPSPHPRDELARRGEKIFEDEGCIDCHTPPHYTNNKLVAVPGFEPSDAEIARAELDVSSRRVDTDPGLALRTRKGTGYYKVPSLRGLWYRGLYGHSGFVASLEDWFDARRLSDDYVPSGWRGPGVKHLAVRGHPFGLDLEPDEKRALIAFLRTL